MSDFWDSLSAQNLEARMTWANLPEEHRSAALVAISDLVQALRASEQYTASEAVSAALEELDGVRNQGTRTLEDYARALPPGTHSRGRAKALAVARVLYQAEAPMSTAAVIAELRRREDWQELFGGLSGVRWAAVYWARKAVAAGFVEELGAAKGKLWRWRINV